MTSLGTKSDRDAFRELEYVKEFLVEKGFVKHAILKPEIQNIVSALSDLLRVHDSCNMLYLVNELSRRCLASASYFSVVVKKGLPISSSWDMLKITLYSKRRVVKE